MSTSSTPARWLAAREWFNVLCDLPVGDQAAQLDALAATDAALAEEVARLLEGDRATTGGLDDPLADRAHGLVAELVAGVGPELGQAPGPGDVIGPWRLVEPLGRGGMGEVFLVERADPLFQQVAALKLLRRGLDSDEVVRRFERERQILARLEHPAIARLLDGGIAPDGRPYLVMERIEGEPITEFCTRRELGVEARIRLVVACCEAVALAHRNLVVHRDLKPGNILVTPGGEVKLLDFGIAKLLDAGDEAGELTQPMLRLLTPRYAAPEQILGQPVTTSADVFALGVLLFELLVGRPPFARAGRSQHELAAVVERESAERPSAAVLASSAGGGDDRRLARKLSGDLDTILLMALRREPERRYASVLAFADDLRRYLDGKPVRARADSTAYRAAKFIARHRFGVAASAVALVLVLGGLTAAVWQANLAAREAARASLEARRAERVRQFLVSLFEMADPLRSGGTTVSAAALVDDGTRRIEHELASEPEVRADLLHAIARANAGLGRLEPAHSLAVRAIEEHQRLGEDGAAVAQARVTLGRVLLAQGKLDRAETELARALAMLEALGQGQTLVAADARSALANAWFERGEVARAAAAEREVLAIYERSLGPDHPETAVHMRNLGVLYEDLDRLADALEMYMRSQAILERHLGLEHPNVAMSYLALGVLRERLGEHVEAERLLRRSLGIRRHVLGPGHPATGQSLTNLGLFLLNRGKLEDAAAAYREVIAIFEAIDRQHFEVAKALNSLALIDLRRGRVEAAEAGFREVVARFRAQLGEGHAFTWLATANLGDALSQRGRHAEAEVLLTEAVTRLEALAGPNSDAVARVLGQLGSCLRRAGRPRAAVAAHERALDLVRGIVGAEHERSAAAALDLARTLAAAAGPGSQARARTLLVDAIRVLSAPPESPRLREAEDLLAALAGKPDPRRSVSR